MKAYTAPRFHGLTPAEEIRARTARMKASLAALGLDAALIVQNVDMFYFSGTMQAGHLLIPAEGEPLLLVRRELSRARAESPLADVVGVQSFRELADRINERLNGSPRRLGLELDVLPVNLFRRYQFLWPGVEMVNAGPAIMDLRAVKSQYEAGLMRQAGELARKVYAQVPKLLKPGLTEIELAGLLTAEACRGGHQNLLRSRSFNQEVYSWHVISGKSGGIISAIDAPFGGYGLSPAFPVGASLKPIQRGEPVLIDFGLCVDGYQVDLTRMFSVGEPPEAVRQAYGALVEIEAELKDLLRPDARGDRLFEAAVARAESLGFGDAFLGPPGMKARFVGHGVGLEINDPPILAPGHETPLQAGMAVALELKMVFPGLGAVGLENTFLVREGEPELLTRADSDFIIA